MLEASPFAHSVAVPLLFEGTCCFREMVIDPFGRSRTATACRFSLQPIIICSSLSMSIGGEPSRGSQHSQTNRRCPEYLVRASQKDARADSAGKEYDPCAWKAACSKFSWFNGRETLAGQRVGCAEPPVVPCASAEMWEVSPCRRRGLRSILRVS